MTDGRTIGRIMAEQAPAPGRIPLLPRPGRNWSVESRPLAACQEIASAWSALGRRALIANPCFEPGFLLPAAQHLIAFREVSLLLVWRDEAGKDRQLVGLMPYRRKTRLLRADALSGCADERLLCDWPLLDRDATLPALSVLLRAFDRAETGTNLRFRAVAHDNPLRLLLAEIGRCTVPMPAFSPATPDKHSDVMPLSVSRTTLREASGLAELRDGVEILLALEASGARGRAGVAALQNTREAAFLRAMTRNLARARLCRLDLLMEQDRPVAAALTLGKGKRRWLYGIAAEPATASETLIAAMRRATPGLMLLARGDRLLASGIGTSAQDLVLIDPAPRKPADLARSLRARLDRALFRPRPLAAGE